MMKLEEFGYQAAISALPLYAWDIIMMLLQDKATIPASYQCGLNVFPVSSNVFSRERIRGHPSAQAA
jgi:hypothetical protein